MKLSIRALLRLKMCITSVFVVQFGANFGPSLKLTSDPESQYISWYNATHSYASGKMCHTLR